MKIRADLTVKQLKKINGKINIIFKRSQKKFGVFIINFDPNHHFDLVLILTLSM